MFKSLVKFATLSALICGSLYAKDKSWSKFVLSLSGERHFAKNTRVLQVTWAGISNVGTVEGIRWDEWEQLNAVEKHYIVRWDDGTYESYESCSSLLSIPEYLLFLNGRTVSDLGIDIPDGLADKISNLTRARLP